MTLQSRMQVQSKRPAIVGRRAFLRNVATASAGLSVAGLALEENRAQAQQPQSVGLISQGRPRRYLYFTVTLTSLSIAKLIEFCKETGLDGVDLTVRSGYPVTPENVVTELPKAARAFKDAGLTIGQVSGPKDLTDPDSAAAKAVFEGCAKANIAGVRLGYFPYKDNFNLNLADARTRIAGFAKLAARTGVRAVVHTHSGDLGNNGACLRLMLQDLDAKHVGVSIDPGHLALNGGPFRMEADILRPWLSHLAIKDVVWEKEKNIWQSRFVPVGEGIVRWTEVRQAINDAQFDGMITLYAVYAVQDLADRKRLAKQELETLKKLLG